MTVTYTAEVATSNFSCFLKLLLRWRGSVYKLVWKDFLVFVLAYSVLSVVYRFALNDLRKRQFERVSRYCEQYNNLIPISFVLGFYVSIVVTRWWDQFMKIPWPDRLAMFVTAHIHGHDERGIMMRRTIMRYLCLSFVITMSSISPGVKKRFPTFAHMVEAGFMVANEEKIIDNMNTPHNKYFIPLAWCTSLVTRARKEKRIIDDFAVKTLIDEINEFRGKLGDLFNYDWISVPLVYTQVVTIAVYTFFVSCLMGRQFTGSSSVEDVYVPIFTFLQFFFYMGWLKVAETLVNPFGEDDDDFDINQVIDRNLQVSYLVVDEMHSEHPQLIKDQYWDEVDFDVPRTVASQSVKSSPFLGSAMNMNIPASSVLPRSIREENLDDIERGDYPHVRTTSIPIKTVHASANHEIPSPSNTSNRTFANAWQVLKGAISRQSKTEDKTDSPRSTTRRFSAGGIASQQTSACPSPSITATITNQDDIEMFQMDLSDGEDELDDNQPGGSTGINPNNRPKFFRKSKDSPSQKRQKNPKMAGRQSSTVSSVSTVQEKLPLIAENDVVGSQEPPGKGQGRNDSLTDILDSRLTDVMKRGASDTLEEYKFKQDQAKVNRKNLPRSLTIGGDDVGSELKLVHDPSAEMERLPRARRTSEHPHSDDSWTQ